jgi:hypothetical protein
MQKIGWSTKTNIRPGSRREAYIVQARLLNLLRQYSELTGVVLYAEAALKHINPLFHIIQLKDKEKPMLSRHYASFSAIIKEYGYYYDWNVRDYVPFAGRAKAEH